MGNSPRKYGITLARLPANFLIAIGIFCPITAYSVTPAQEPKRIDFEYDLNNFRSNLNIPVTTKDQKVGLPIEQIATRLARWREDPRIEPLQLTLEGNDQRIMDLAVKVAQPEHRLAFANYLKENFAKGEEIPGTNLRMVTLDKNAFSFVNQNEFNALFSKVHHDISIKTSSLKNNAEAREQLLDQLSQFFSASELLRISKKIKNGSTLSLDKDLLPDFAKQRVANHTIFKGPNCFHAALAFQSPKLASSQFVNVRREKGYHNDMINYDELWRVLQRSFYEVDPLKSDIQYGDMIVFFETKDSNSGAVDFKTLRHAATYLLGGYVFAKGSKSANSPYLVRTLGEEWDTWTKYTKRLGVKVFRRNLKHVTNAVPADPIDWVY